MKYRLSIWCYKWFTLCYQLVRRWLKTGFLHYANIRMRNLPSLAQHVNILFLEKNVPWASILILGEHGKCYTRRAVTKVVDTRDNHHLSKAHLKAEKIQAYSDLYLDAYTQHHLVLLDTWSRIDRSHLIQFYIIRLYSLIFKTTKRVIYNLNIPKL